MANHTAVMTGATGFLGSHFLVNDAAQAYDAIVAIVRGPSRDVADARLRAVLEVAAAAYPGRPAVDTRADRLSVLAGDIEQPACGLGDADVARLRDSGVDAFWHFAASLAFEDRQREQIYTQNVTGARHALELARAVGARRFVHVSTAYSAGLHDGLVEESLHSPDGPFNNVYEQTKCSAEHLVHAFCAEYGMACTVLRPSIVVGPAASKRPGGATTGLYGFVRELVKLRAYPKGVLREVRMHGSCAAEVNLIPVDCLMHDVRQLVERDFGEQSIYHLAASRSVSFGELIGVMKRQLDLDELVIREEAFEPDNRIERQFRKRTTFYDGYIRQTKRFARALPSHWAVTTADAEAFVEHAIAEMQTQMPAA